MKNLILIVLMSFCICSCDLLTSRNSMVCKQSDDYTKVLIDVNSYQKTIKLFANAKDSNSLGLVSVKERNEFVSILHGLKFPLEEINTSKVCGVVLLTNNKLGKDTVISVSNENIEGVMIYIANDKESEMNVAVYKKSIDKYLGIKKFEETTSIVASNDIADINTLYMEKKASMMLAYVYFKTTDKLKKESGDLQEYLSDLKKEKNIKN